MDILFENEKQKEATERVLATVRIKSINKDIDLLISEMLAYAKNIDTILERNELKGRYLDRVSNIDKSEFLDLDDDLLDVDFRIKEVIEDLIKRINTRVRLIKANNDLIDELERNYDLTSTMLEEDIELSKLDQMLDEM